MHVLGYGLGDFPIAEMIAKEELSLPLHPYLSENDIIYIVQVFKGLYRFHAKLYCY